RRQGLAHRYRARRADRTRRPLLRRRNASAQRSRRAARVCARRRRLRRCRSRAGSVRARRTRGRRHHRTPAPRRDCSRRRSAGRAQHPSQPAAGRETRVNPRKPNLAGPAEPASQPQTLRPTCARVAAPRHLIALIAAAVLPLATHAPQAAAQGRPEGPVDAPALRQPSPYLPHTHWAARALARLNAAGLGLPGYDAGRRTPRLIEVAVTFERAATDAAGPALRARAAASLDRKI